MRESLWKHLPSSLIIAQRHRKSVDVHNTWRIFPFCIQLDCKYQKIRGHKLGPLLIDRARTLISLDVLVLDGKLCFQSKAKKRTKRQFQFSLGEMSENP